MCAEVLRLEPPAVEGDGVQEGKRHRSLMVRDVVRQRYFTAAAQHPNLAQPTVRNASPLPIPQLEGCESQESRLERGRLACLLKGGVGSRIAVKNHGADSEVHGPRPVDRKECRQNALGEEDPPGVGATQRFLHANIMLPQGGARVD
jgi:hypothetical protein